MLHRFSVACAIATVLATLPTAGQAQPRELTLSDRLAGDLLGEVVDVYEDPEGTRTLDEVRSEQGAQGFIASDEPIVGFGFTRSAAWLRLRVDNPTGAPRTWLLELGFPPIDHVSLFEPSGDGYRERASGDRLPFEHRDVPFRHVVYRITQPPGSATYYLRVRTEGSLQIPLRAWTPEEFMQRLSKEQPLLWLCYGALASMCLYNLFIFLSVRSRDYLYYVLFLLSYSAFQLVLNGLAFQYLWPEQVWWANQCLPVFNSLSYFTGLQFLRYFLGTPQQLPRLDTAIRIGAVGALMLAPVTLAIPYQ